MLCRSSEDMEVRGMITSRKSLEVQREGLCFYPKEKTVRNERSENRLRNTVTRHFVLKISLA